MSAGAQVTTYRLPLIEYVALPNGEGRRLFVYMVPSGYALCCAYTFGGERWSSVAWRRYYPTLGKAGAAFDRALLRLAAIPEAPA